MFKKHKAFLVLLIALTLIGCGGSSNNDDDETDNSASNGEEASFSLSGRILVASNTAVDSDVNDVNVPVLTNNSTHTAQQIPNPVILGGYVNQPGAGYAGHLKDTGDINDFFEVDLRAGQTISLFVANQNLSSNDLDLGLLDSQGVILNASVGEGATESLTVPADGHYFIQVQAFSGASNYTLSIGQNITTTSHGMKLNNDFVPGELIVQIKPDSTLRAATLGMQTQSFDTSRRMLFSLEQNQLRTYATDNMRFATPELRTKYETLMAIKALRRRNDIIEASPNYRLSALRVPNDTLYHYQWNLPLINLPQAWDTTTGDPSVIVAVIDTGVLLQHPDLRDNIVQGYDFIENRLVALDGDGIDPNPDDPGDQLPGGSSFHGTHIAGIVAATTNNNKGVAGVAWQTKIMPLRVLGKGGEGSDYDTEQAMRFAAGLTNDAGTVPVQRADIINLSLGGTAVSPGFQGLINEVRNAGVIVVAAAGNENTNIPTYPASLDGVISVSAVDISGQRASYANFGAHIDVTAPGGDNTPDINGDGMSDSILSTIGEELDNQNIEFTFSTLDGTSMAAPHIAGVISLMKAVNPALTPQDFDQLLESGNITDDLGSLGRDDSFGYGLINAQKAVLAAIELGGGTTPQPAQPLLVVSPQSLNFGLSLNNTTLRLSNGGGGDLRIENLSDDSGGFLSWEGSGLGDYIIKVDRSSLTQGTYTATLTITSSVNIVKVPVILQVGDPNITGDAGLHYVLLVDPDTLETVQEVSATVKDGVYDFSFDNVPKGKYIIAAGSDFNNDGFICDVGEACGAFPIAERPTSIEVTGNRSDISFSTGFSVNFLSQAVTDVVTLRPLQGFARLKIIKSIP